MELREKLSIDYKLDERIMYKRSRCGVENVDIIVDPGKFLQRNGTTSLVKDGIKYRIFLAISTSKEKGTLDFKLVSAELPKEKEGVRSTEVQSARELIR